MDDQDGRSTSERGTSRRGWLQVVLGGFAGIAGSSCGIAWAQDPKPGAPGRDDARPAPVRADLESLRHRLEAAGIGPLETVGSAHYEAIGDAPEAFIKLVLEDCEQLAADYLRHFRAREFEVRLPDHRMLVVMLRDNRSFARFLQLPAGESGGGPVLQPTGVYDRKSNVLQVFDWRRSPMTPRSGHRNIESLAHEGTHQLTFNTGLLNREGDVPLCIVEGLGTYGEARQPIGPGGLGRQNLRRLEDIAKLQRQIPWIPVKDLIADDAILRTGKAVRVLLGYAQSWLLVHYFLKTPAALPKFRDYLKAIAKRTDRNHRLDDAHGHLGDLDALDRELRRYSIRLLNTQ
jgi:hypothetical protein